MNKLPCLICGIILLTTPANLRAQRRSGGRGGFPTAGAAGTDDMAQFKRAIALQATPDQIAAFRHMGESTEAARKEVQDLLQLAQGPGPSDLSSHATPVTDALDEAQGDNAKFLLSFSSVQKSDLKAETKKLAKANSEISRQSQALTRGLDRPNPDEKQIVATAEKLSQALTDFQARQIAVGGRMGIQSGNVQ